MAPDTAPNGDQDRIADTAAPHEHEWRDGEYRRHDVQACECGALLAHGQVFYPSWEWLSTPEGTVEYNTRSAKPSANTSRRTQCPRT